MGNIFLGGGGRKWATNSGSVPGVKAVDAPLHRPTIAVALGPSMSSSCIDDGNGVDDDEYDYGDGGCDDDDDAATMINKQTVMETDGRQAEMEIDRRTTKQTDRQINNVRQIGR